MSKHLTSKDFNKALPAATAEKFEVIGLDKKTSLVIVFHQFGKVDFRSLSIQRAEHLLMQKAPFIQRKKAPVSKTSKEDDTESGK